ncbi:AT-rich interactive domain-containing protein 3A [Anas platyrhynchos]|uniref:AT-rich interactive domain-containing protein 3 n=1 Tax=Anas platyrhynchos TaxID=8839 RepID=R0JEY0_ANAPL|nr:AT-rich interactive domain-containing protein 3A [Anas platyrhynchos]
MQKRGTSVNRIPIMAKQVLDLYTLYLLVMDKGSLVEVINKKIWREITKGLNLPTSITSAAFTLRTQYMKYLYPYECEKRALSLPGELQAAIDSKQREGWRQTFGTVFFNYSSTGTPTLLGSPKMPLPALSISTHSCGQMGQVHGVKKGG